MARLVDLIRKQTNKIVAAMLVYTHVYRELRSGDSKSDLGALYKQYLEVVNTGENNQ